MNTKIIVSSKVLRKELKNMDLDIMEADRELRFDCINRKLIIDELFCVSVESKIDFEAAVTVRQLRKLCKISGIIEEQPIVLEFSDSTSYIGFSAVA